MDVNYEATKQDIIQVSPWSAWAGFDEIAGSESRPSEAPDTSAGWICCCEDLTSDADEAETTGGPAPVDCNGVGSDASLSEFKNGMLSSLASRS